MAFDMRETPPNDAIPIKAMRALRARLEDNAR
jgi:hypothetical protein